MRIVVIDGHPDSGRFGDALAHVYIDGARSGGHDVRILRLREMAFDPILHGGFTIPTPFEPDLLDAREAVRWCQHLVIVAPCWWWSVPTLLKGFIDRVFLPGFGVEYLRRPPFIRKLMKGRPARVIYTQNSPQRVAILPWENLFWRSMRRGFLGHRGFGPIRRTLFASMEHASQRKREGWLWEVNELGRRGR